MDKTEKYRLLTEQIRALIEGETDVTAVMANVCAAIHEAMGFWWTGFYRVQNGELILGPFQGPVACMHIGFGKGVCGTAWKERQTIIVPDVEQFPGHIACSSLSRSEIVVPVFDKSSEVAAVLDIDSKELSTFNDTDRLYLEGICSMIAPLFVRQYTHMEHIEIILAKPEDTDFIAWIVAQGMHMDGVPPFLKRLGARDDTLYSWKNTRLLRCDGKLAGGLISYDGATHEEGRRKTWVMPDGRLLSSGDVPETTAGEYYLDSLAITPEFRGRGLWRVLFDDAVAKARRRGFHRVTLICDEDYPKLAKLYTSYGFVAEDTFSYFDTLCRKMSLSI